MNIDIEKFVTDLDEHLKKRSAELNTDERAKQLCAILGCVKVKSKDKRVKKEKCLVDIIDVMALEREIKAIVSGARTEIIYEYQDFVRQFAEKEESGEEDEETASCLGSRSGTMCEPSTENRGEALQTLCAVASPARTSALQETGQVLTVKEAAYGKKCHGLFARLDQESSLWKTPQLWLFEGLESSLETWPRWGMMQNGECFLLPMLEHTTSANEYGSWPTPRKSLIAAACTMATVANIKNPRGNLEEVIFARSESKQDKNFLQSGVNPEFCEWLMVWPIGWTGLGRLETDKFQQWQNLHGRF